MPRVMKTSNSNIRATSFAACSLLIFGIEDVSNGFSGASGSLMYETSLASSAERENTDSDTNTIVSSQKRLRRNKSHLPAHM